MTNTMLTTKKRGLGKGLQDLGLNELLSETNQRDPNLGTLPVEQLQPGRYQPRQEIDKDTLQELADSIRSQGIIQPLIVRAVANQRYEIIAGERRWRAAQLAGLTEVPAIIRELSDESAIAVALIENIQREDLNAIDMAVALQRLMHEFSLTQEQAALTVGKARTTVSNLLRLLALNDDVKILLQTHQLEMGHARALLALTGQTQSDIATLIAKQKLSVREAEQFIRRRENSPSSKKPKNLDVSLVKLQMALSDHLGAAVTIQQQPKGHGKLIIRYNTPQELQGIFGTITENSHDHSDT